MLGIWFVGEFCCDLYGGIIVCDDVFCFVWVNDDSIVDVDLLGIRVEVVMMLVR